MNKIALKAVKKAGNISKLARLCGVSRQAVQQWLKNGLPTTTRRIQQISAVTGLSKKELKPEWYS